MWDHRLIKVGDNNDAEVDIAGRADVSRFQTELDLGGILAVDAVICSVFEIEPAGTEQEAHQAIVLGWLKYRFQIEGVFPVGFPSMDDSGIVSVLLLDAILLIGGILNLPILAEEVIDAVISPADKLEALYNSHAFTMYSSSM